MSDPDNPEAFVRDFVDKDLGVTFHIHKSGSDGAVYASRPFRNDYIIYANDKEPSYCDMHHARRDCPGKDDTNLCPGHPTRTFIGYLRNHGDRWLPFRKEGRPLAGEFERPEEAAYAVYRSEQTESTLVRPDARAIVYRMLEADEVNPEDYLKQLPPRINREEVLQKIFDETAWCLDDPTDHRKFVLWIRKNAHLFPDTVKAMTVAMKNHTWCTDNEDDMDAFLFQLGFPRTDPLCPRCDGSGDEPGAPYDEDQEGNALRPLCDRCHGTGQLGLQR